MTCIMIPCSFASDESQGFTLSYSFDKQSYQKGDEINATVVLTRDSDAQYKLRGFTIDVRFPNLNLEYVEKQVPECGAVDDAMRIATTAGSDTTDIRLSLFHMSDKDFNVCGQTTNIVKLTFKAKEAGNIALRTVPVPTTILISGLPEVKPAHPQGSITITNSGAPETSYSVAFARGGADGGKDPSAIADQTEGGVFNVPACAYTWEHHRFKGWLDNTGNIKLWQAGDVYTMPAKNVTFTAQWEQYEYKASFSGGEGAAGEPPAAKWYEPGPGRILPAENTLKKTGYTFEGWSYNGKTYKTEFTMPSNNVLFTAVWKKTESGTPGGGGGAGGGGNAGNTGNNGNNTQTDSNVKECPKDSTCPIEPFTDTSKTAWWHDGIHYCLENGLMNRVSENRFAPDGTTTRSMIVTILWRIEKSPSTAGKLSFADVPDGKWYTEAIRWAQSTGVVTGYSDERFGPDDSITREQLAAIFYRYAGYKKINTAARNTLSQFADTGDISGWALESIQWANAAGLINGRNSSQIAPRANATRAESASMIQRFCENTIHWNK